MIKQEDALELLKQAINFGIIKCVDDSEHVVLYHEAGKTTKEGWYKDNIYYAAESLSKDEKSYNMLKNKVLEIAKSKMER